MVRPRPVPPAAAPVFGLRERLEDSPERLGLDADAGVADLEDESRPRCYGQSRAARRRLA